MKNSRLRIAWDTLREYGLAVLAAALLTVGIKQFLGVLTYLFPPFVIRFINFIIRTGFRDHLTLMEYGWIPWRFQALLIAEAVIGVVLGIFVGLWVNARVSRRYAQSGRERTTGPTLKDM